MSNSNTGLSFGAGKSVADREDEGTLVHVCDERGVALYFGGTEVEKDGKSVIEGLQPVTILVAGSYSHRVRKAEDAQRNRSMRQQGRVTGDDVKRNALEIEAAGCIEWQGILDEDGRPIPCTLENAIQLLAQLPWVRSQVYEAAHAHARFFDSTSST